MFTVCTMQSTKRGEREGRHTCTRTGTALEAALLRGGRYASAQQRRVGYACCCKYSTASRSVALCVSTSACHARLCASSVGARAAAVRSRRRAAAAASLDASLDRASSLQTQRYENQQELRMGRCVCVCLSLSPSLSTSLSLSLDLSLSLPSLASPCQCTHHLRSTSAKHMRWRVCPANTSSTAATMSPRGGVTTATGRTP